MGGKLQLEDKVPEEALEPMRKAFAENDTEALTQAMIDLGKWEPKHRSLDGKIDFWVKEFSKAWGPESQKDKNKTHELIMDPLDPFMPQEFKDIERDRVELEK